ncbi:MAG: hypothetical protein HRU40_05515 [Saprospiraceae bacterium]|nr:hypothetical protein [Saprospiraceae bacterium]
MARRKYKLTGFARFFIVMLFLAPVAYLAASYINGEDGVAKIQELLNWENEKTAAEKTTTLPSTTSGTEKLSAKDLEEMVFALKDSLREKNIEIHELRRQIRILKGSSE